MIPRSKSQYKTIRIRIAKWQRPLREYEMTLSRKFVHRYRPSSAEEDLPAPASESLAGATKRDRGVGTVSFGGLA